MDPFWRLAKMMLVNRLAVAAALVFVFISAGGLGAGLMLVLPMLRMILEESMNLQQMALQYNAGDPAVAVPAFIADWLPTERYEGVRLVLLVLFIVAVVGGLSNFVHQYLSQTIAARTVGRIRQSLFDRVIHFPLGRVVHRGPSQLVSRIVRDTVDLQAGFIVLTSKAISNITKGVAAFAAALIIDWKLTIGAVVFLPIVGFTMRRIGRRINRGTRRSLQAQEDLLRISTEALQGLRAVKANTGEAAASTRFGAVNEEVVRQELRIRTAKAASSPMMETLATAIICVIALVAAKYIIDEVMTVERFFITLAALAATGSSFRPMAGFLNQIQASSAPARRVCELLDDQLEDEQADHPVLPRHCESIEFEHVCLTYPDADEAALDDVSLDIAHGQRVAIVGPNGSGKTTLLSLLPRLLTPDRGVVRIDGTDVATVNLKSLRRQIGVVTQETVLFRGSIADNVAFGTTDVSREQIMEAARKAHAHEFITRIPGGYDANVAEQGASLSGGQRQRIAIARAILRDPSILVLDEATSQIDAESEHHINEAIAEFCRGRTTLVIAHRLSTVLGADVIVVMDRGRIVGRGSHDELLAQCELYRRLTQSQFGGAA